ncbi:MAG TPA: hypothetical protein VFD04_24095, partial [Actinomycetes bacterium]|nr:hypothetical protein [Actinomycetes bacterium]
VAEEPAAEEPPASAPAAPAAPEPPAPEPPAPAEPPPARARPTAPPAGIGLPRRVPGASLAPGLADPPGPAGQQDTNT